MKIFWVIVSFLLLLTIMQNLFFSVPYTKEYARERILWILEKHSDERGFDLDFFGDPIVSGSESDSFRAVWSFYDKDKKNKLRVIISVTEYNDNFTGSPFILDCRPHRKKTREFGFGYLCKK